MRKLMMFSLIGLLAMMTPYAFAQNDTTQPVSKDSVMLEETLADTSTTMTDTSTEKDEMPVDTTAEDAESVETSKTETAVDTTADTTADATVDTTADATADTTTEPSVDAPTDTTTQTTAGEEDSKPEEDSKKSDTEDAMAEPEDPTAPYKSISFEKGEKPQIRMETTMGTMVLELWPDLAPKHCQSFLYLTRKGYFDSLTIHRIVPGFVLQGGCPNGNGTGGPGYTVPAEFNATLHEDGILSMARTSDPNSAGSQFFICLGRLTSLDNQYTVFGKVIEGMEIAHKIEKVPVSSERPTTPVVMTKVEEIGADKESKPTTAPETSEEFDKDDVKKIE